MASRRAQGWLKTPRVLLREGYVGRVTGNAFCIYQLLRDLANGESRAWPSVRQIERYMGIPRGSVTRGLATLESAGWIEVVKRGSVHNDTTTYRVVNVEELDQTDPQMDQSSDQSGVVTTPSMGQSTPAGGTGGVPQVGQVVHAGGTGANNVRTRRISTNRIITNRSSTNRPKEPKEISNLITPEDVALCDALRDIIREWRTSQDVPGAEQWEFGGTSTTQTSKASLIRRKGAGGEKHGVIGPVSTETLDAVLASLRIPESMNRWWIETNNLMSMAKFRDILPKLIAQAHGKTKTTTASRRAPSNMIIPQEKRLAAQAEAREKRKHHGHM